MLLFAPKHSAAFATAIAQDLGTSLSPAEEREFDGGEHKMRPLVNVQGQRACVVQSLFGEAAASVNDKLCRLLFFVAALKDAGAREVTAAVPYLAYGRKDRRTQPQDPVTTRYVAALFEAVGLDRILALDVHNEAAFDNAFRCHSIRLEAAETFAHELAQTVKDRRIVVASPDIGGVKRAQRFGKVLSKQLGCELDVAFVEKHREHEVVSGETLVGAVEGSEVIFYDDMIVSGTTVLRAARAARRNGAARVHVVATHAAFAPSALQLFQGTDVDRVLVSDSIALPPDFASQAGERLKVLSVAPLFARALRDLDCEAA
ncbi:MAG TPA: ribose-phosphate diphosphokinase [Steroidobacteraceae bacterium]